MRLTKTLYIINTQLSDTPSGYDADGRPYYQQVTTKTPFLGEVEPYSNKLAETRYGLFVDVTNRVFIMPNDIVKLNAKVEYNGQNFVVTECMQYDKHYEVLLKKVVS